MLRAVRRLGSMLSGAFGTALLLGLSTLANGCDGTAFSPDPVSGQDAICARTSENSGRSASESMNVFQLGAPASSLQPRPVTRTT
jgi:hypothetical protein